MYIINETFFIGEIQVPNTTELQGDADTNLEYYVDEKVRLFLQKHLGSVLYDDLDSNITNGTLDVGAPQKWLDFVNGCNYTKDDKVYTWKGLQYSEGIIPKSLLANYVFVFWLEDNVSTVLGTGEVRAEAHNAMSVNSTQRLVRSWNKFVEMYQGSQCSNNGNFYFVDGVPFIDYYNVQNSNYVTMVTFLKDNATEYPDTNLGLYAFKNQLGL